MLKQTTSTKTNKVSNSTKNSTNNSTVNVNNNNNKKVVVKNNYKQIVRTYSLSYLLTMLCYKCNLNNCNSNNVQVKFSNCSTINLSTINTINNTYTLQRVINLIQYISNKRSLKLHYTRSTITQHYKYVFEQQHIVRV